MKTWILEEVQGSPEWLAGRRTRCNASDLACAMGIDPNGRKRSDLVKELATGIDREFSDYVQERVINPGHEIEAAARIIIEQRIDESLYPVVLAGEVDGIVLGASLDGITIDDSTTFECKSKNAELWASVLAGMVPKEYCPQMEQGLWLSGADICMFTVSDGTDEGTISCEYRSDPELRGKIIPTWKQLEEDVRDYNPASITVEEAATGRAPDMLPALHIEVTGMVTASNLAQFKKTALAVFRGINTNLQTDQDFADAEKTVKFCKDAEERLDAAKSHALSQTASIDELFRTIDQIKDEAKAVRLKLDKLVKGEKENRKAEIVTTAQSGYRKHIDALNERIGGKWMPSIIPVFADSIKGLKSLDSMRDKIATTMANAKIEANECADRIQANKEAASDCMHLFPDFANVCTSPDFAFIVVARKAEAEKREAERLEAERARIRAEEQAKAEAEAQAKARAEQEERYAEAARIRAAEQAEMDKQRTKLKEESDELARKVEEARQAEIAGAALLVRQQDTPEQTERRDDTGATLKLGEICTQLGFNVTADFILSLGFSPVGAERAAKLYRASDFNLICAALIAHIRKVMK